MKVGAILQLSLLGYLSNL